MSHVANGDTQDNLGVAHPGRDTEMRKAKLSMAALLLVMSLPAMAQSEREQDQDIGGHYRHMHRDWSQQEGRHTHNVCWQWDAGKGWVWICR